MTPKKIGKSLLCILLENQVKRLRERNQFSVIAVGGSVGKTSTKLAIAKTLQSSYKVIFQDGNYNDRLTVPLVIFNRTEPSIYNLIAWVRLILKNERTIKRVYPYNIVVVEIGTDAPGQLKDFAYLKPDLFVLTAIAHEHMSFFNDLNAVAKEELTPISFSKTSLLNIDNIPKQYLPKTPYISYGSDKADYLLASIKRKDWRHESLVFELNNHKLLVTSKLLGMQGALVLLAAASAAKLLGVTNESIKSSLENISPAPGRLSPLNGFNNTLLLDDTYNAIPVAVKAALNVLYDTPAPEHIAVLGGMNELGKFSEVEHQLIGTHCDPSKVDLVVTIGESAKKYLAPAAAANGCQVESFASPVEAGQYVKEHAKNGAAILFKGSQNGIFAEEALKALLERPSDASKLVRQSPYWLKTKRHQLS